MAENNWQGWGEEWSRAVSAFSRHRAHCYPPVLLMALSHVLLCQYTLWVQPPHSLIFFYDREGKIPSGVGWCGSLGTALFHTWFHLASFFWFLFFTPSPRDPWCFQSLCLLRVSWYKMSRFGDVAGLVFQHLFLICLSSLQLLNFGFAHFLFQIPRGYVLEKSLYMVLVVLLDSIGCMCLLHCIKPRTPSSSFPYSCQNLTHYCIFNCSF